MLKRVAQALATGAVTLPSEGTVAVFDPPDVPLISDLDLARVQVISPSARLKAACESHGIAFSAVPQDAYCAALVFVGRARQFSKFRLAQAASVLQPNALLLVDGQKTDGIESTQKDCAGRLTIIDSFAKAHGRLFWGAPQSGFDEWTAIPADWPEVAGFRTGPGVFSADGIDPGSALLAEQFPSGLKGSGADLGAGWGFLSKRLLDASDAVTDLHLVEDDHRALTSARHNVPDPRARFAWGDALTWTPEQPLDFVITNPPFHAVRGADPSIGRAFIQAAARVLARHGQLLLVANRHLPYEATLADTFHQVTERVAHSGYKVIVATSPKAATAHRRHR